MQKWSIAGRVGHVANESSPQASADAEGGTSEIPRGSGAIDQIAQRCAQLGIRLRLCRRVENPRKARSYSSRHDSQVPQVLSRLD